MRLVVTVATAADARRIPVWADLVELRLDLLAPEDAARARTESPVPVLATVRSAAQGGRFSGSAREAADALLAAARAGAAWVDAEETTFPLVASEARALGAKVLGSVHGAPPAAPPPGADAWKVARPVTDAASFRAALEEADALAEAARAGRAPPGVVVPYGPVASALRVRTAAAAEGAGADPFVFAAPDGGRDDARLPDALRGQIGGGRLLDELRLGEVTGRARLFGLLGRPPSRSPSPAFHAAAFRALGLDALYLPEVDLDPAEAFRIPVEGWSVTTPRKEAAAERCDALDPLAEASGAVNTVVRRDGRLLGWNTDVEAVADCLSETVARPGGEAWVLGGGGFARAAAVALRAVGLAVTLVGDGRARGAARALGVAHASAGGAPPRGVAVVVNATPLGADGRPGAALDRWAPVLAPGVLAIDAPYGPEGRRGAFADRAAAAGARVVDGHALFLLQARRQATLFCGREPDPIVVEAASRERAPLVLVGLRGSGKSTVGRAVAALLGRPFVDTDDEVARAAGRPVGRVLAESGEAAFRALEARSLRRAASRRGVVVSTGGGVVEASGAEESLARACVVHLAVAPPEAARRVAGDPTPRPRLAGAASAEDEARRLLAARGPAWARVSHATVATDGRAVADVAAEVGRRWLDFV